jgi:hypothetical protein
LKESELDYYIIYFSSATIFKPIVKRPTGRNAILPGAVRIFVLLYLFLIIEVKGTLRKNK